MTDMLRAAEGQQGGLGQSQAMQSVPKPNRINSTNVNGSQNPSHDASTATSRVRLRSCNQEPTTHSMMAAFDLSGHCRSSRPDATERPASERLAFDLSRPRRHGASVRSARRKPAFLTSEGQ